MPPSRTDALPDDVVLARSTVFRQLKHAFPAASPQEIEDAVQEGYVQLLRLRAPAWPSAALLYTIGWRQLRGVWRHRQRHPTLSLEGWSGASLVCPPGQDAILRARRYRRLLQRTLLRQGGRRPEALAAALAEKLHGDVRDTELAARHGLHRERINRAWRSLVRAVLYE